MIDERLMVVLGTSHDLQMAEKRERRIEDPGYIKVIEQLSSGIGFHIDIIFEEASGCGPTAAQRLAEDSGWKYVDVDPHVDDRHLYGLARDTGRPMKIEFAHRTLHEERAKREEFWVKRIKREPFHAGLMICGFLHTLSLAERLDSAGFEVHTHCYVPHDKLCRRVHPAVSNSSSSP